MPLGYCGLCHKLTSIQRHGAPLGRRTLDWYPVTHDAPTSHKDCAGIVEHVDGEPVCSVHGPVPESEIEAGTPCDGHRHPIR
jgi:hypothetical protein